MPDIKIIALDLDATLLDSQKKVSQRNLDALERVRQMGILMVPVPGRPAQGLPQAVLDLPGLRRRQGTFREREIIPSLTKIIPLDRPVDVGFMF